MILVLKGSPWLAGPQALAPVLACNSPLLHLVFPGDVTWLPDSYVLRDSENKPTISYPTVYTQMHQECVVPENIHTPQPCHRRFFGLNPPPLWKENCLSRPVAHPPPPRFSTTTFLGVGIYIFLNHTRF